MEINLIGCLPNVNPRLKRIYVYIKIICSHIFKKINHACKAYILFVGYFLPFVAIPSKIKRQN